MSNNQAEICKTFFKLLKIERETRQCGRILKQRKGTVWNNLYAHVKVQHQQKSKTFVNYLPDQELLSHPIYGIEKIYAQNLDSWLERMCMEPKLLEFAERDLLRKHTNLQPICRKVLMKYMHLNSVSVALQKIKLDKSTARLLIDETAKKFHEFDSNNNYLGNNDRFVMNKHFETANVTIFDKKGNEHRLIVILQCKRMEKNMKMKKMKLH